MGIDALNPYLKHPVINLPQQGSVEPPAPQTAVLVTSLDPTRPGKQVFVSNFAMPCGLYGLDGRTGAPLAGFWPVPGPDQYAGYVFATAVPTVPEIDNPNGLPVLLNHQIFESQLTGLPPDMSILRLIDATGAVMWSQVPSVPSNHPLSTATFLGRIAGDGSEDAFFVIDEEDLSSHGRSGRTGEIVWTSYNPVDQQITSPAVMDIENGPANAAFVFCRGRVSCVLEKHRASDGTMLWQHDYGSNHIFPFVAVGHVIDASSDEVVIASRQDASPAHLLLRVIDGTTGALRWEFDTGEAASWGPAPVLADVDGDGLDEILVQTNTELHLVHYPDGEMPGWPVTSSTAWDIPSRSEPVVGDLDGDGVMDIALFSEYGNVGTDGLLDIFDANGQRKFFPDSVLMPIGDGVTPAIADIDDDGHNELILANSVNTGNVVQRLPSIWVLDFSRGQPNVTHGAILWGQFGSDAEHSARAVDMVPKAAVSPTQIRASVARDSFVVRNLAIGNRGGVALQWAAVGVASGSTDCANAKAVDWISLNESAGTIQGGHDHVVSVRLDSAALAGGLYHADLCVTTSDSVHPELPIPVMLEVLSTTTQESLVR